MIFRLASCLVGGWLIVQMGQHVDRLYTGILAALRGLP